MTFTVSNASVLLKRQYPKTGPSYTAMVQSALLAEIAKDESFRGEDRTVNVRIAGPTGVGNTFSNARANKGATTERRFVITRKKLYAMQGAENEAIFAAEDDGSIVKLVEYMTETLVERFNEILAVQLWNGGALTKLTAAGATLTNDYFTCDPISDAARIRVGDKLAFASDNGTAASPAGMRGSPAGETVTVTAVNYATGKVTVSAVLNTIDSIANTDFVFLDGSYSVAPAGVKDWIPITAPTTGDSHFSVDRTISPTQLAGWRYTATGLHTDALRRAMAFARQVGSKPDRLYVNPNTWAVFESEIGTKSYVDLPRAQAELGHVGIRYMTPAGAIILVSEPQVPEGYGWALRLDTWKLATLGAAPRYLLVAGSSKGRERIFHPLESADQQELRLGMYGNTICSDPGQNGVIAFASA